MATGRVKWFNDSKGFGLIETETGEDIFVHYTAIKGRQPAERKSLAEGQEVDFDIYEGAKGPLAQNVMLKP